MLRYFLFIACVCLLSCKAQKESKPMRQEIKDLVLVDHHSFSGIQYYEARVIRDAKSLKKFYTEVNKTRKPGLPVPIIDFSKEMVILVSLGQQFSDEPLSLLKQNETDDQMSVMIEIPNRKSEAEEGIQSIYYPFYLYKMPIIDKSISIQRIEN